MKLSIILAILFLCAAPDTIGQDEGFMYLMKPDTLHRDSVAAKYEYIVLDGDTMRIFDLPRVSIYPKRVFGSRGEQRRYDRLVRNVKRVYPYAKLAGQRYLEYQELLSTLSSKSEQKKAMKQAERDIREQFESELKLLTFSQGIILIKLIDRETQNTTYEVVKEFRGFFTAIFWQGLGSLFGFNLKTKYDPDGKDALIEEIVQQIELGYLPLP